MTQAPPSPVGSPNDYVRIFDTTLRDGEQSPGASMSLAEKLRIAEILEALRVDVIEAGFAIASNGDFEAVHEVAKLAKTATVASLARAARADIDRALEALKPAQRPRIHTFIATSPLHMRAKLNLRPEAVLARIAESVSYARRHCADVEWSAEDATRSELDFLCRAVETAIKAGASTINLPDTVGYTTPHEYYRMFRAVMERVPDADTVIFSTHCHNDLGLAVANSLSGVEAGARQVECTINGIGERAGNAAMEEVVMALKVRQDAMPFRTGIATREITRASRLVSTITGFLVQNNKAIVGANAFAHESGIHQDGVLKDAKTYEIMTPESVGLARSSLVMGKHSGRHAFAEKLKELGYDLGRNALEDAFLRFKALGDRKKQVFDEDIIALVDDAVVRGNDRIHVVALEVHAGSTGPQRARLTLAIDGAEKTVETTGNGPVDATFNAIRALLPDLAPDLVLFQVHAVTQGTDAQAEVTVRLQEGGKTVNGQGADADTLVASARAYVNAVNKLLIKREKTAPGAITA
ncbi:MAG: 2-isopropylmalate synthase [Pseudomonadota bacterium]